MQYSTVQEAENEQAVPVTIELTDSVPDMVVTPPELPEITVPEDFDI